jgi:fibronectin-binding autotransporter adhesin
MKPRFSSPWGNAARLAALSASLVLTAAHAADFTWDANTGTAGPQDGSGTWDNANSNWISGGANTPYVNSPSSAYVTLNTPAVASSGITTLTFASVTGLAVGQETSLASFPIGTTITNISGNVVTFSQPSNTTATAAGNANYGYPANNATVGAASGAAGTITVASAQNVRNLTLNAAGSGNYTFTGPGAITVGSVREVVGMTVNSSATFENAVNVAGGGANNRINFNAAGQTLTFTGGGSILSSAGNNSGISGSSNAFRESSTIAVTSGIYSGSNAIWNIGDQTAKTGGVRISGTGTTVSVNALQLGREAGKGSYATVSGGSALTITGQGSVGRSASNSGTLTVDNATVTNNYQNTSETSLAIGREGGVGKIEIVNNGRLNVGTGSLAGNTQGGTVSINSQSSTASSVGTLDIISGVAVIKDIRLNGTNQHAGAAAQSTTSSAGTAIINLASTGALYLGGQVTDATTPGSGNGQVTPVAGGLSNRGTNTSSYQVNLNGGTLGASAAWTSSVKMTLGAGTNTNFKAANEAGTTANNMTFTGQLTGSGGWTKTGGGTVTLNSSTDLNNYTGGSTISEGAVTALATNSFGTGNVTVGAATLTLGTLATIADTAGLYFGTGSVIKLDYTGTDVVSAISNGTLSLGPGTYTVADLTTQFGAGIFSSSTGLGTLTIIPEPTSAALLGLGVASLAFSRRRRVG